MAMKKKNRIKIVILMMFSVIDVYKRQGYEETRVVKDLAGLDRVVLGRKKQEEHHV